MKDAINSDIDEIISEDEENSQRVVDMIQDR